MSDIPLVIVGSVGLDTVETPLEKRENILGGSVSYACAAASFFGGVGMVGVIGDDFPNEYLELYEKFGIDTEGLQREKGQDLHLVRCLRAGHEQSADPVYRAQRVW